MPNIKSFSIKLPHILAGSPTQHDEEGSGEQLAKEAAIELPDEENSEEADNWGVARWEE